MSSASTWRISAMVAEPTLPLTDSNAPHGHRTDVLALGGGVDGEAVVLIGSDPDLRGETSDVAGQGDHLYDIGRFVKHTAPLILDTFSACRPDGYTTRRAELNLK